MQIKKILTLFMVFLLSTTSPAGSEISVDNIGDLDKIITLPSDVKPADITYLDGYFWAVDLNANFLYKLNPVTGAEVLRFNIGYPGAGLTTDGTNLIVSAYTSIGSNGTIARYQTDGNLIDSFSLPIQTWSFFGLGYSEGSLWASQVTPNRLIEINPTTNAIKSNTSVDVPLSGLAYLEGSIWAVAHSKDKVYKINPSTGRTLDVFPGQVSGAGDWGMATDGTSIYTSEFSSVQKIYKHRMDVDVGEVYNTYTGFGTTQITDIAYYDGKIYAADFSNSEIVVLDAGNYSKLAESFTIGFNPRGLTTDGSSIFVSHSVDHDIWQYTMTGTFVKVWSQFSSPINGMGYDGTNFWVTNSTTLHKLNTDGVVVANYTVNIGYTGIAYVPQQEALWVYDFSVNKLVQLNVADASPTGVEIYTGSVTSSFDWGAAFDGEHIIIVDSNGDDELHKIKIDLNAPFVKISNPTDGNELFGDTSIDVLTGDNETGVVKVIFSIDGEIVSNDTFAPFTYAWNDPSEGTYDIRVEGFDEHNNMAFDEITVTVKDPSQSSTSNSTDSEDKSDEIFGFPRNEVILGGVIVLLLIVMIRPKGKKK